MIRTIYYVLCIMVFLGWQPSSIAAKSDAYASKSNQELISNITTLLGQGRFQDVLSLVLANLPRADSTYGKNNKLSADLLMFGAMAYQSTGQLRQAKEYYQLASERQQAVYGPFSIQFAGLLNNFGKFLQDGGDFRGAAAVFNQSLVIKRKLRGPVVEILPSTLLNSCGGLHQA